MTMPTHSRGCARKWLFALSLVACVARAGDVPPPLVDEIWDVREQRMIHAVELDANLTKADFVLLGEIHDNREQHRRQASVLVAMVAAGRRPAIAFEQFDREYQAELDRALGRGAGAEAVTDAGHFDRRGWGWDNYAALIELAVDKKLPIVAANLSRVAARDVAAKGFGTLQPAARELAIDRAWSEARDDALIDDLVDSHCGKLPRQAAGAVARAQRARDAVMADRMLANSKTGVVLIAGAGHARRDLGVPLYLEARAPHARIVSVAFTEVRPQRDDPAAYDAVRRGLNGEPRYDYVWFTPAAQRDDPCASLAARGPMAPTASPGQASVSRGSQRRHSGQ
jgi:uncharacterized iron-regulated protein